MQLTIFYTLECKQITGVKNMSIRDYIQSIMALPVGNDIDIHIPKGSFNM